MGEDLVIENNLNHYKIKPENVTYLDIGTNDPCDSNNTYMFYKKGARGVLVEPDKMYWPRIAEHRPDDKLIKACVGDFDDDAADFYILTAHSLNTLIKETADHVCGQSGYGNQKIEEVVKMPVINVNRVLEDNFEKWPNIISVDTEGMDYRIINAINWGKYKAEMVCIEVNEHRDKIADVMLKAGYNTVCDNGLNLIYMRQM